jgi:hypothetical protein
MLIGIGGPSALGASQIHWWCWDEPGFKKCHGEAYANAQQFCGATGHAGYTSMDSCVVKEADIRAIRDCPCADAPPPKAAQMTNLNTALLAVAVGMLGLVGFLQWRRMG